ncbi:MAG: hypothetical protein AAF447_11630 [Myxococcota bacterium]
MSRFFPHSFEVPCTLRVAHTMDEFTANVELDGVDPEPGDSVLVHGEAPSLRFGDVLVERRQATVRRAGWFERTWTRLTGDFECLDLLEVSFTDRRTL